MHSGQKLQAAHMDQGIVGYVYLVFGLLSMIHFETGITGLQGHIIGYAHDFESIKWSLTIYLSCYYLANTCALWILLLVLWF